MGQAGTGRIIAPGVGRTLPFIGTLMASASDTGGAFEVIDYVGPATPPPHVHREHEEAFYILAGTFRFLVGHDWFDVVAGSLIVVPRGARHGFETERGARALLLTVPAGLEGFFADLGQGLSEGRSGEEIRAALAGMYDSHPEPD